MFTNQWFIVSQVILKLNFVFFLSSSLLLEPNVNHIYLGFWGEAIVL